MKNTLGRIAVFALAVPSLFLAVACSSAPEQTTGEEQAMPNGGWGGGGGGHPKATWPLKHPHYCSGTWSCGSIDDNAYPTPANLVAQGCASTGVVVGYGGCHPANGPDGMITGWYALCPGIVASSGRLPTDYCTASVPQAPGGQVWVLWQEAVGPCQSGCHMPGGDPGPVSF